MKFRKRIQVKHTSNTVCLFQMFAVTNIQCNCTDFKGKSPLKNQLITTVFLWRHSSPQWARASSISSLHDHTQTHHTHTHCMTPLGEWSARNRDLCLITKRHPWPRAGFEPAIPTSERPQTHDLDRVTTGTGNWKYLARQILFGVGQRFSNCGPRTTSGPRVLPLWSF